MGLTRNTGLTPAGEAIATPDSKRTTTAPTAQEVLRKLGLVHFINVEPRKEDLEIINAALVEAEARGSIQRDGAWLAGDVTAQTLIEQARAEGERAGLERAAMEMQSEGQPGYAAAIRALRGKP